MVQNSLNATSVFPGDAGGNYHSFLQGMLSARLNHAELWNVPEIQLHMDFPLVLVVMSKLCCPEPSREVLHYYEP